MSSGDSETATSAGGTRALVGAVGAPLAFVVLWLAPLPLEAPAHRLAAIFGAILVAWVTEVLPIAVSALLVAPLLVLCDVATPKESFKHYADPLLFLFIGGFFIAESMRLHGLDRRIAKAIVTSRWVSGLPSRVRLALMLAGGLISMWISNTATAAILVPIFVGMMGGAKSGDRGPAGTLLSIAYICSIGGLGTLVGSPPNVITVRLLRDADVTLRFVDWLLVGVPMGLFLAVGLYFVARWMFPTDDEGRREGDADLFADVSVRWSRGEIVTAAAFGLSVLGWTLPGVVAALGLSVASEVERLLDPGVVALVASALLFAAPDGSGGRVLRWRDAAQIDWGIILLFGGGIALGTQLVETGLAAAMSRGFIELTGIENVWALTFAGCFFTIFFTEVCSNTATATMLVPLVIAVAIELGVSPVPPALGVGISASCAFMLPIATGPNAIVYSTGRITQGQMIRMGLVLNFVSLAIIFALLRVLCPLYGWI